jgi:hypothetical protein
LRRQPESFSFRPPLLAVALAQRRKSAGRALVAHSSYAREIGEELLIACSMCSPVAFSRRQFTRCTRRATRSGPASSRPHRHRDVGKGLFTPRRSGLHGGDPTARTTLASRPGEARACSEESARHRGGGGHGGAAVVVAAEVSRDVRVMGAQSQIGPGHRRADERLNCLGRYRLP